MVPASHRAPLVRSGDRPPAFTFRAGYGRLNARLELRPAYRPVQSFAPGVGAGDADRLGAATGVSLHPLGSGWFLDITASIRIRNSCPDPAYQQYLTLCCQKNDLPSQAVRVTPSAGSELHFSRALSVKAGVGAQLRWLYMEHTVESGLTPGYELDPVTAETLLGGLTLTMATASDASGACARAERRGPRSNCVGRIDTSGPLMVPTPDHVRLVRSAPPARQLLRAFLADGPCATERDCRHPARHHCQ